MRGLSRGIGLLLILFTGFMIFDVLGRQPDEISNDTAIDATDEIPIQVQAQLPPAVTPEPVLAAPPAQPTLPAPTLIAQVIVPPTATPAPKLERAASDDLYELSNAGKSGPTESVFDALLIPFV